VRQIREAMQEAHERFGARCAAAAARAGARGREEGRGGRGGGRVAAGRFGLRRAGPSIVDWFADSDSYYWC
jgi:hypothetical protein